MEFIDICVLILAILIVFCVIRYQVLKKRIGKSEGCGGGCGNCPMGGSCGIPKKDTNEKIKK